MKNKLLKYYAFLIVLSVVLCSCQSESHDLASNESSSLESVAEYRLDAAVLFGEIADALNAAEYVSWSEWSGTMHPTLKKDCFRTQGGDYFYSMVDKSGYDPQVYLHYDSKNFLLKEGTWRERKTLYLSTRLPKITSKVEGLYIQCIDETLKLTQIVDTTNYDGDVERSMYEYWVQPSTLLPDLVIYTKQIMRKHEVNHAPSPWNYSERVSFEYLPFELHKPY